MDEQTNHARAGSPGVPWGNLDMQRQMSWRDGDIVISVPVKSGTTWMMNIVHQLRCGGDPDFVDIYAEVPWIEFVPSPDSRPEELIAGFDAMSHDRRRAFKTHSPAGVVPYFAPGTGPDVEYIVVVRNPDEAIAALPPFTASHSDAWLDLWHIRRDAFGSRDIATLVEQGADTLVAGLFRFVAAWWPLRHEPNVLLVHFADLKREQEASVRRVADFLGIEVDDAQWPEILEYTSFAWMKAHEDKFERKVGDIPLVNRGGMIRKGQLGTSGDDGVTETISKSIADIGRRVLADESAFEWCYAGGSLRE
jgi:hypothetical protein